MTPARRALLLVLFGVGVLVLSLLVIIRNRSPDDEMLAVVGLLGGAAIVVVSLPDRRD